MKTEEKIPFAISSYITDRFREDFLLTVKEIKTIKNQLRYTVEVSKDNFIHTLQFNQDGKLINDEVVEAFVTDEHDEKGFDTIPE